MKKGFARKNFFRLSEDGRFFLGGVRNPAASAEGSARKKKVGAAGVPLSAFRSAGNTPVFSGGF
jgi:hypothetical protein